MYRIFYCPISWPFIKKCVPNVYRPGGGPERAFFSRLFFRMIWRPSGSPGGCCSGFSMCYIWRRIWLHGVFQIMTDGFQLFRLRLSFSADQKQTGGNARRLDRIAAIFAAGHFCRYLIDCKQKRSETAKNGEKGISPPHLLRSCLKTGQVCSFSKNYAREASRFFGGYGWSCGGSHFCMNKGGLSRPVYSFVRKGQSQIKSEKEGSQRI